LSTFAGQLKFAILCYLQKFLKVQKLHHPSNTFPESNLSLGAPPVAFENHELINPFTAAQLISPESKRSFVQEQ
jgi:hypothetical protein